MSTNTNLTDEARHALAAARHTPGPWFVGAQNDSLYVLDATPSPAPYDGPIPREYGPNVVATPNFRIAGYKANARLIAAAPDLLAAIKVAVQLAEVASDWNLDEVEIDGEMVLTHALAERFRVAIAKAEGSSHG
jgi:hypothetical protein